MFTSMRMFDEAKHWAEEAARSGQMKGTAGVGAGGAAAVAELIGRQAEWSEETANYEAAAEMYIKVRQLLSCCRSCCFSCCCFPHRLTGLLLVCHIKSFPVLHIYLCIHQPTADYSNLTCRCNCVSCRPRSMTVPLHCWSNMAGGIVCCSS